MIKIKLKNLSKIFDIKNDNIDLEASLHFCKPKKRKFILSVIKYCKTECINIVKAVSQLDSSNIDRSMKKSYMKDMYTSPLLVSLELIEDLYTTLEYLSKKNLTDKEKKDIFNEVKDKIFKSKKMDYHIGCYSYPNCDIDPNGCHYQRGEAETYGHRD